MKKNILIMTIIALLSIMMANADTAPTCSMVAPAANSANTGSTVFNATISSNGIGVFNVTGINFSVAGSVVGSDIDGINSSYYNATVDTSGITDVFRTTVTANIIINGTTLSGSCTSTKVDFDNTNPVCSCQIEKELISLYDILDYDCGASTDTTDLTYSCVSTYADTTTETQTDELGKFEATNNLGEASVVCTVTDEVSKTNSCSALTFRIKGDGDADIIASQAAAKDKGTKMLFVVLGIAAVAVVVIIMATTKKSKKKKKR